MKKIRLIELFGGIGSQLYKQAGNSIVVNVLEAIMKNMFIEVEHEEGQVKQERLFL